MWIVARLHIFDRLWIYLISSLDFCAKPLLKAPNKRRFHFHIILVFLRKNNIIVHLFDYSHIITKPNPYRLSLSSNVTVCFGLVSLKETEFPYTVVPMFQSKNETEFPSQNSRKLYLTFFFLTPVSHLMFTVHFS